MQKTELEHAWSLSAQEAYSALETSEKGLSASEAAARLKIFGENTIRAQNKTAPLMLLLNQLKNPIIIILIIATSISAVTGDLYDSLIILAIILGSAVLSFFQEYSAGNAIEELRSRIQIKSSVLRDGTPSEQPSSAVVPGDIVMLAAGSLIPADGLVLSCNDFYVNQSILTGESYPVEKRADPSAEDAALDDRTNCVYMGTSVRSGTATVLITRTGSGTEFGKIAKQLTLRPPETEFDRGVRRFGYLLTQLMLVLTLAVFAINVMYHKPVIDSLLFSVALAVGITPQLLPAIVSITLAKGSRQMAREGVIVRRLTSIENFGSMDVLCTDKTGTLTEGVVQLDGCVDTQGAQSESVFRLAYLNASLQNGLPNALDAAIISHQTLDIAGVQKLGEIPYDFFRKRLSVIVREGDQCRMVVKGALNNVLEICDHMWVNGVEQPLSDSDLAAVQQRFAAWSDQGIRVLGVAAKTVAERSGYVRTDEVGLTFMGFLLFFDPPKKDVRQTIAELAQLGVNLRIITGDNRLVAQHVAESVGLTVTGVLTGAQLGKLTDEALWKRIETTNLFAEVDPNQKERIILALKKKNHVVGYMGDGINDAPALHAADVSISVNTAVDVAKDAADFVLMESGLAVLKRGIELGRTTFANTIKYILITTSANFGNMFSMAGASLFMQFLPLLPKQILLINFLTDFPAITIANDAVDTDQLQNPRRWDTGLIQRFMFTFGLISSLFDYVAFAVLLSGFHTTQELFQSGWFVLSVLTELLTLLVVRTRKPFFKSRPAPLLLYSTLGVGAFTLLLPFLPVQALLNITPIPLPLMLALLGIAVMYVLAIEIGKYFFYRHETKLNLRKSSR
ncbi:MAG TPA: magnesium-translocating P-type ATPase [Candidatus Limiplasma sp.]|nr:magnesium-translocating P-type ATPase [Candidatus Limiplasma sp.]